MDTLHTVLRSIRGETKARRDTHLDVFREFLDHLDRAARRRSVPPRAVKAKLRERGRRKCLPRASTWLPSAATSRCSKPEPMRLSRRPGPEPCREGVTRGRPPWT